MSNNFKKGAKVSWNWGNGTATGTVQKVHTRKITKTIKGAEVTRKASEEDPAYTIKQGDGDLVLKGHDELREEA